MQYLLVQLDAQFQKIWPPRNISIRVSVQSSKAEFLMEIHFASLCIVVKIYKASCILICFTSFSNVDEGGNTGVCALTH